MNEAKRNALMAACRAMLDGNNIKPTSKKGKELAWAFWVGAMRALDEAAADPYVTILLVSGRVDELIGEPEELT